VQELLSEQDAEGGWVQERGMTPDAYATGLVLVALHEVGGLFYQHSALIRRLAQIDARDDSCLGLREAQFSLGPARCRSRDRAAARQSAPLSPRPRAAQARTGLDGVL
jgi:hypothetical protein